MLFKKEKRKKKAELDVGGINEVVSLSKTILKIVTVLLFIVGAYISIIILKELNVKQNILTILKIISPLFIGFFVAWLFDPFVTMKPKGNGRGLGLFIVNQLLDAVGCTISLSHKRNSHNKRYIFILNFSNITL